MLFQDARKVVGAWELDFSRSQDMQKKLALIYLANDVLQNSRKKGPQFLQEFYKILPKAIKHMVKHGDSNVIPARCLPALVCQFEHWHFCFATRKASARLSHTFQLCRSYYTCGCCQLMRPFSGTYLQQWLGLQVHRAVTRTVTVWEERSVFGSLPLKPFQDAIKEAASAGSGWQHVKALIYRSISVSPALSAAF